MRPPRTMPVFGRDAELTTLARRADSARRGLSNCAVVRGPHGIGKTTVLNQVAAREATHGGIVLRPEPTGGRSALYAIADLLGGTVPSAAGLSAEPYPVFRRLHHRLTDLAGDQSLCLLIDDLPAGDTATPSWLDFTLRRAGHLRLFVVAATRPDPSGNLEDGFAGLAVNPDCTVLDFAPLPLPTAAGLVAATMDFRPEPGLVEICHQLSAGNPMRLLSLLTRLRSQAGDSGTPLLEYVDAALVATTVVSRFGALPGHARTVAVAIAVLGRVEPELLGPLSGMAPDAVADAIHVLDRECLLWQGRRHARLRDWTYAAILGTVDRPELTRLRTRAAVLLQDNGRPADEIARQLVELEHIGHPWMSRVLFDAATAASSRGAATRAAEYLSKAREGDPDSLPVRADLAIARTRTDPAGGVDSLPELFEQATDPVLRGRLAFAYSLASRACGPSRRAHELLLLARKELDAAPPRPGAERVGALLDAGLLLIGLSDPSTAAMAVEYAAGIERPSGRSVAERCLLGMLADTAMRAGGPLEQAERDALLAVSDDAWMDDWATPAAATVLRCAGRFDEAISVLSRAVSRVTENNDELGRCRLLADWARTSIAMGGLDQAERHSQEAYTIAERNSWLSHEPGIVITLALAKAKLNQPEEAQRLLDEAARTGLDDRTAEQYEFRYATAWIAIARHDWQAAVDDLFECGRIMAESNVLNPVLIPWWADAAVSAFLLGQHEVAISALECGVSLSRRWSTPEGTALVMMIRGLITSDIALLSEAVERFSVLPTPRWHAFAEFLVGREHFLAGDDQAARPHLRRSISLAQACGETTWAAETHRILQQAGGRMRLKPSAEHDLLTVSERRVVEMAAAGETNRQIAEALFVSLRTVELHLTRAYRKLGISSRAQLRAAAGVQVRSR